MTTSAYSFRHPFHQGAVCHWLRAALFAIVGLAAGSLRGQEQSDWEISLSVPWRSFGRLSIAALDMTPDAFGRKRFLDGHIEQVGAGLYAYTVADPLVQIDAARLDRISYTDIHSHPADKRLGTTAGIDLELRRQLRRAGQWKFGLLASLRWAGLEQALDGTATIVNHQYSIHPNVWPSPNPPGGGPDPEVNTAYFRIFDPLQTPAVSSRPATVRHDVDLDVYEFGLGGYAAWESGNWQLGTAAAPVLALPRLRVHSTALNPTANWPEQGRYERSDPALAGFRLGADIRWRFRAPFFVAGAAEYQWFADSLKGETHHLRLDGFTLRAVIGCTF